MKILLAFLRLKGFVVFFHSSPILPSQQIGNWRGYLRWALFFRAILWCEQRILKIIFFSFSSFHPSSRMITVVREYVGIYLVMLRLLEDLLGYFAIWNKQFIIFSFYQYQKLILVIQEFQRKETRVFKMPYFQKPHF